MPDLGAMMSLQLSARLGDEAIVIPLCAGHNRIGRSLQPQIGQLPGVSRCHADVQVQAGRVEIHDLGSRNRTRVNGHPVRMRVLRVGDEIELGELRLVLEETDSRGGTGGAQKRRRGTRSVEDSSSETTRKLRGARLLDALTRLAGSLAREDATDPACQCSLERIAAVFRFRSACLFLLDEAGHPELRYTHPRLKVTHEPVFCRTMVEDVVQRRRPLLVSDAQSPDEPWVSARLKGVHSAVAVPMLHEDRVIGAVYLDRGASQQPFRRRHLGQLQALTNLIAAKVQQCQSHIDLRSAAQIQRHMLCDQPRVLDGYEVATRLQPCKMVGGDFYEILTLPDGRSLYALGDVSGKGVGAALIMAETLATLRALARTCSSPLQLTSQVRAQLAPRLAPRRFVTLFVGMLDPCTRCFEYVNAGHEPGLVLVPGRTPEWLDSTGPPVGMEIPVATQAAVTRIPAEALLGLWSDGLTEAMRLYDHTAQMFTRERILECIGSHGESTAAQIVDLVFREIESFTGNSNPQDDRTLLVVKGHA